jgi:N-acyl-phosphatidylethanolamine-hydrolysing phospholipase D
VARKIVMLLMMMAAVASCSFSPAEHMIEGQPPHHTNLGFQNIHIEDPNKSFFSFLWLRLFGDEVWADVEKTAADVPFQLLDINQIQNPASGLQVSWLGHSTFLLQHNGINILTDPIFSNRASPLSFTGPKRYVPHAMDYGVLPPIDFVVISHNHYDHLDSKTIARLANTPTYMVPLGLKKWFVKQGINKDKVIEMDWWQRVAPNTGDTTLTITAQPSQHWSARGLGDRRKTLWASWRLDFSDVSVWFAGDTGYNPVTFKEIAETAGSVDLALIPIGAYSPRSFMKPYHVNPDEAVMIHQDIKARRSIGMHWGTFALTAEAPMDPPHRLAGARAREGLLLNEFSTLAIGETIVMTEQNKAE